MNAHKKTEPSKSLWTPARLAFTILVLSLVAAFGISSCSSSDEQQRRAAGSNPATSTSPTLKNAPGNAPRGAAPFTTLPASIVDAELKAVSGEPIKLSNYAGKVLVINLWATWCGPCRSEIPELVKLHEEFRSQGLEVVGLSTEDPDTSADKVRNFVHDFEMSYRVGWATNEVAIALMAGRDSIPQSFVIARDGQVLKRFVGFNPTITPVQIREAVEGALNQKAAD